MNGKILVILSAVALAGCETNTGRVTKLGDMGFYLAKENDDKRSGVILQPPLAVWDITGASGNFTVKYKTDQLSQSDIDALAATLCDVSDRTVISTTNRALSGLNTGSTGVDVQCGSS